MALSSVPSSPIFSPLRKFFISASAIPSSIALHSRIFCSISSSSPITTEIKHSDSFFPIFPDSKIAEKLGQEEEDEISTEPLNVFLQKFPIPRLSIKEKKELASYAHSLGKKLKSQQIGKSGVTPAVSAAMVEAFEANELLKLKVHGSCPGELSDVIKQLENTTGSAAVGQIGRTVILYRPSLTKMKKNDSYSSRKQQQIKPVKSTTVLKTSKNKQVTRTFRQSQQ